MDLGLVTTAYISPELIDTRKIEFPFLSFVQCRSPRSSTKSTNDYKSAKDEWPDNYENQLKCTWTFGSKVNNNQNYEQEDGDTASMLAGNNANGCTDIAIKLAYLRSASVNLFHLDLRNNRGINRKFRNFKSYDQPELYVHMQTVYWIPHREISHSEFANCEWCTTSLKEVIGAARGSAPPLDFMTRLINSKFWVMESDVWADLLIICRWANPTTITHDCPECGKTITMSIGQAGAITATVDCATPGCAHSVSISVTVGPPQGTERIHEAMESAEEYSPSPKRKCIQELPNKGSDDTLFLPKDLGKLVNFLLPARNEWYFIGLNLNIPAEELDDIETNTHNNKDCLRKMLRYKLKKILALEDLHKALLAKNVDQAELAKDLTSLTT